MTAIMIEWVLGLLAIMIAAVLHRVWNLPAMVEKLENVGKETDNNRHKIHMINNTLHHHEHRISTLEKANEKGS
jgi:HD-like signal output (HDOD) protein